MLRNSASRYGLIAIAFHWGIAAGIIGMIGFGLYLSRLPLSDSRLFSLVQIHKSIGLTILVLSGLRVAWRLFNPAPALPPTMPGWEKIAAHISHYSLYALTLIIPLSGWALVSSSPFGLPTLYFGTFQWPHISFLADLPRAARGRLEPSLLTLHLTLALTILGLLIAHVAAALRHHILFKDDTLKRMLPGSTSREIT